MSLLKTCLVTQLLYVFHLARNMVTKLHFYNEIAITK